jgi:hypothetical protein
LEELWGFVLGIILEEGVNATYPFLEKSFFHCLELSQGILEVWFTVPPEGKDD